MSKIRNQPNYNSRGVTNKYFTSQLFLEIAETDEHVRYTLLREDVDGYPSLYKRYMEMEDFTEFEFANLYFESFQHWKRLCQTAWFAPYIAEWREELELQVKARNLKSLIRKAENDSNVAKYLLNNKWVEDAQSKNEVVNLRGRPSKEEIKNHLRLVTAEQKKINEDLERITA